jgi:hypothetical protein
MLVIRADQLEMFERIQFDKMQQRIECAIAHTFPDTCTAPFAAGTPSARYQPNLYSKALVEKGIEAGLGLGLEQESDLAAFIALGLALQAGSVAPPGWITEWLMRPDTPGTVRLAVIESRLAQMGADDPLLHAVATQVGAARRACVL